jgi:hypothetical protein
MSCARLKGQSTLEYVILLGFVIAALIAMGVYMKRGAQGQLREASDRIGQQYEAGKTTGLYTVESEMVQHESLARGGHITTDITTNEQRKTGGETVVGLPPEDIAP